MNIAQLVDSLEIGGMQRVAVDLANAFAAQGHNSYLICTRDGGPLVDKLAPNVKLLLNKRRSRYDFNALRRIANYLSTNDVGFVQSHNDTSHYFTQLCLLFHKTPRPYHICHAHSEPQASDYSARGLRKFVITTLLGRADLHVSASEGMRDFRRSLLGLPDDRCVYLPNAITVPPASPSRFSKPGRPLEILQVANLHWPKGHANALHIAGHLRRMGVPFVWRMVGRIPRPGSTHEAYYDELLRLRERYELGESIIFSGEQSDIAPYLASADVGVLSSDSEAFPITVLEYMAAELPVVLTDVGQNRRIVTEAECGEVHAREDHESFAKSLARLSQDVDLRLRWGQAVAETCAAPVQSGCHRRTTGLTFSAAANR